ncbi:MAG TPA: Smr/MutS family protein [Syntrophomonadaceae bacterium]|nr:Smr/MutS family protein [Syntrophomonadaceae bacterium]
MKVQSVNLHGLSVEEALAAAGRNLEYCIAHGVDVVDFNHGKGYHSSRSFSVIKQELRKMLQNYPLRESGYRVIYGESEFPVALTYDEGHTLVVVRGKENEFIGGRVQQEKNHLVFSEEGKKTRKEAKRQNSINRRRRPH